MSRHESYRKRRLHKQDRQDIVAFAQAPIPYVVQHTSLRSTAHETFKNSKDMRPKLSACISYSRF